MKKKLFVIISIVCILFTCCACSSNKKDLITVEINPDNYFDYFDLVVDKIYDSFGDVLVHDGKELYTVYTKSLMYDKGYIIIEESDDAKVKLLGENCSGSVMIHMSAFGSDNKDELITKIEEIKKEGIKVQGTVVYDLKSNHKYETTCDTRTIDEVVYHEPGSNLSLYPY